MSTAAAGSLWGLEPKQVIEPGGGQRLAHKLWLSRGIVIPWLIVADIWEVFIRRPTGEPKYVQVPGGSHALYGADALRPSKPAMLCEAGVAHSHSNVHKSFKGHLRRASLPETTRFHDLRHSCAGYLLSEGVPLKTVSDILGYSQNRHHQKTKPGLLRRRGRW